MPLRDQEEGQEKILTFVCLSPFFLLISAPLC